ncbi:hypothetical protein M885DRAFT_512555 [Pelagophyceae sp. CCMP2097]|nr:hypothetical protein M885DRAFT_512555 [Pelagophyceae sp. CCMP2097]
MTAELVGCACAWLAASAASYRCGARLAGSKGATWKSRLEDMDKILLSPYFAAVGILALYASFELSDSVESRWRGSTRASRVASLLYCVKMASDVPVQWFTLANEPAKRLQMTAHHALSFVAIGNGLFFRRMQFFACLAMCSEVTTVFLNAVMALKHFTDTSKGPAKFAVTASGLLLWLTYVVFRLFLFPCWFYVFVTDSLERTSETWSTISVFEQIFDPCVIALLLFLSVLWFGKITQGLLKALRPRKKQ